ncbi:hypothetical protein BYT27DRAFT_7216943 [Phlegmacium glaucopus]|nr:hypothetical protein BYT27DRAFT_7216943 [Phlegmacium glaucopus]
MSGSPSPSPLLLSVPLVNLERPPKRPRVSSFTSPDNSPSPVGRAWNPPLQQEFGEDLCKLLIATRSSWNTAHNPQMQLFVEKWIPGAIVPDRRTLSGPILDREAGKVEDKLKLKLKGWKATFQTDGWKNKAKQAIIATMVSVDFETGETLLQLVVEDIKWSEETYCLSVIAACSDDGGDARKMRRLLLVLMPWLIIILCWAHQINLIVGDYLSLKLPFQDCIPKALIITVMHWDYFVRNNYAHTKSSWP